MQEVYNFGAGPACLPPWVLTKIKADIPDWYHGMSVMEIGHRSAPFLSLIENAEQKLRNLLKIPDDFYVLFMQGGARAQFAAVALNLYHQNNSADYILSGHWSVEAHKEAARFVETRVIADAKAQHYTAIPQIPPQQPHQKSAEFLHYTDNETIHGVEFHTLPEVSSLLVSDMTSSILSKSIDWQRHALIYASAQKNLGIAGVTVVVVRKQLLGNAHPLTPAVLDYQVMAESRSLYNTCPVFPIYVLNLMLEWAVQAGGVEYFDDKAKRLSQKLYAYIDNSNLYRTPAEPSARSRLNIPFSLKTNELDQAFLKTAEQQGLMMLTGHRVVGGCRASLYNAMPESGVDRLLACMQAFERTS